MAKEYEGSSKAGSFSPNKTLRLAEGSKENDARILSTLDDYNRIENMNNQTIVNNYEKDIKGWEDLGKFSKTLTKKLVEDQQAKNLEDYEAGVADAYMNGIPKEEAEDFDKQEAAVNAVGRETDAIGAEYAEVSGSEAQGERISSSSGWRALGRATGLAKRGAAEYPMFLAMQSERLAAATSPEDYAATLNEIRREYTGQFGGMNRAMMAKYMFPKMHETENASFMSWQRSNNELIKNNRVDEMGRQFYSDVQNGNGGQGFVDFIEKNQFHLKGKGKAREKLFELLEDGIASGQISEDNLTDLENYEMDFNGRKVKLGTQFSRQFGALEQKLRNKDVQDFNNTNNERKIKQQEILDGLRRLEAEQGQKLSEEQKREAIDTWRANPELGALPGSLNDWLTEQDVDEDDAKRLVESKIKAGLPVTEEDMRGLSVQARQSYGNLVKGADGIDTNAKNYVKALVNKKTTETDGETAKTPEWEQLNENAQQAFAAKYNEYLKVMEPDAALNSAKTWIAAQIESEQINSNIPNTQGERQARNTARAFESLKADPDMYNTQLIPGTEDSIELLRQRTEKAVKSGKTSVEIPQIYHTLASGLKGVNGWDLANQQMQLAGLGELPKPEVEEYVDSLPSDVRELFKYKPTPARAIRAGNVIEYLTGDRSHGGYREDHGGSNYHEHIAFDSPETTKAAIDLLESNNIFVGSRNDGVHADDSYHYQNQAFDVPLYPNLERFGLPDNRDGEEQFSAMVRDLLGKNGFGGAGIRASRTQPVSASHKQFLDFIAADESNGDYEAFNTGGSNYGHTAHGSGYGNDAANKYGKPITQMTVGEVVALGNRGEIHAAGRYQIINKTLKGLVKNYGIDPNALYDEEMQDQLALKLAYQRLVRGNKITGLRNEWVSLQHIGADRIRSSLGGAYNNPELLLQGV